jgi:hypothetical protein
MKQMTFATAGFERYGRTTRRAKFLAEMERVVPWRRFQPVGSGGGGGAVRVAVDAALRRDRPGARACARRDHDVSLPPSTRAARQVLADLVHGEETRVWGNQVYRGQTDVIKAHALNALDFTNQRYRTSRRR